MEYWPKNLLEDLPGGRAPPKLKKTRDIRAKPRSQTNFEKKSKLNILTPKSQKMGGILVKKPTGGLLKGKKKKIMKKIPNTEKKQPEKVLLKESPRCRVGGGWGGADLGVFSNQKYFDFDVVIHAIARHLH